MKQEYILTAEAVCARLLAPELVNDKACFYADARWLAREYLQTKPTAKNGESE